MKGSSVKLRTNDAWIENDRKQLNSSGHLPFLLWKTLGKVFYVLGRAFTLEYVTRLDEGFSKFVPTSENQRLSTFDLEFGFE